MSANEDGAWSQRDGISGSVTSPLLQPAATSGGGPTDASELSPWSPNATPVSDVAHSTPIPPPPGGPGASPLGTPGTTIPSPLGVSHGLTSSPVEPESPNRPNSNVPVNPYPEPRRGWPLAAKLTAGVLLATSLGLGGWALSARSSANTKAATIVDLQDDLARAKKNAKELEGKLAEAQVAAEGTVTDAEQKIGALQTDLATASADRDAARAQATAYAGLFPLALPAVAGADPTGNYALTVSPIADSCTGYADLTSACGIDSFPSDITVTGDATAGYVAASTWFDGIALSFDGRAYVGSGPLKADFGNLCDSVEVPTTVSVSIGAYSITPSPTGAGMKAVSLAGRIGLSTAEAATCIASSRSADVVAQLG